MTDNKDDQFYKDAAKLKKLMHTAHDATKEGTLSHEDFKKASTQLIKDLKDLTARINKDIAEQEAEMENNND